MLKNHVLVTLRNVLRQPGYAAINVFGLALGVACCLLIFHFVQDELAFDRFHEEGDRIHRLVSEREFSGVGWPYGRILETEYPEVERVVYMRAWPAFPILHEGERYDVRMRYAEASFFDVFSFPLLEGSRSDALAAPYSVVLSESLAARLFGNAPALGRTLILKDTIRVAVTGVAHVPRQSHIQFDALFSMETLRALMGAENFDSQMATGWLNVNMVNYVLLREGADRDAFAAKVRGLPMERAAEQLSSFGSTMQLGLEPLRSIYLRAELGNSMGPSGDISYVYLLSVVGLLTLLLAGVNFVNLATARSAQRVKEVGVRKALGAGRSELVRQFLAESMLTSLVAVLFGAGLARLALPYFSDLAARSYTPSDLLTPSLAVALLVLVATVGLLAGLYPALALSRPGPVEVLRGRFNRGREGVRLRQALVVLQFTVSSILLVGTLVVLHQLRYMQSQPLGFDQEQVLVVDVRQASGLAQRIESFKEALTAHNAVESVSAAYAVPGRSGWQGQLSFPEGMAEGQSVSLEYIPADHDFAETLGLAIVAGRDFDVSIASDAQTAVVVNEAAVRAAGWGSSEEAVGKSFSSPGSGKPEGRVIGVVRDYHHHGLRDRIEPIMYGINPGVFGLVALRIDAAQAPSAVRHLEATWEAMFAGTAFEYSFLDVAFDRQYVQERRLARIFATFAGLAVIIACLGLFALTAFTAEQRTKEIGVRKVLGASVAGVVALLSKDFLKLVLIGFVVAAPVAYWASARWLEGFAYRINVGAGVYILAGVIALSISLLTVSYHAFRAATMDPVKALRSE